MLLKMEYISHFFAISSHFSRAHFSSRGEYENLLEGGFTFFFLIFIVFKQQVLISHQFYTHQCIHVSPNLPIHHTPTPTPLPLSPLGVHTFVLYICVSISALQTGSSVPFSRFHIYALIYGICLSLSDLLHSVCQSLSPSTSQQMTQFRSFLWLSDIPLYICATSSLSIHLLMDDT